MRNLASINDFRPQLPLSCPCFDVEQHIGNLEHFYRAPIIDLCPPQISCRYVHSALRTGGYKVALINGPRKFVESSIVKTASRRHLRSAASHQLTVLPHTAVRRLLSLARRRGTHCQNVYMTPPIVLPVSYTHLTLPTKRIV